MTAANPFPPGAGKAKRAKARTAKPKRAKARSGARPSGPQQPAAGPGTSLDPVGDLLREFNARFMVVNEAGKAMIYAPRHDPILRRTVYDRMSLGALEQLYANRFVESTGSDGSTIRRNAVTVWFHHADRRQFIDGVTFDPASINANPNVLNLWSGFGVAPRQGSWGKLQEHVLTNICGTDTALFDHLLDLLADMVQHPEKQGEIAIVLRGKEGCGKGTLAKALLRIFGQHGLHISNGAHFVGRFNLHLGDCVFLFVDEAFFAGDKQHTGVLKALITESLITIEGKFANATQAANRLHVLMATNEDWAVPASLGSRRFVAFDVSDTHIGDHTYFAAIDEEMNSGGHEAMLHDLLHRDLTGVNLRAVVVTDALIEQRKRSLDTFTSWWMDCLQRGYVFVSRLGLEDHFHRWHEFVTTELLHNSYLDYAQQRRDRHPLTRELFGKSLREGGAKPESRRNQMVGEHMKDIPTGLGGNSRVAEPVVRSQQAQGYHFGTLDQSRDAFTNTTGLHVDWETVC
jgi:hypothetical protein